MLDINQQTASLVKVVRDLIGDRLAQVPAQSGTIPAVFQNRAGNPQFSFPYATVDHIAVNPVGYSSSDSYLDDNFDYVDQFDYIGSFTVQINAGIANDALGICTELRSRLFTNKGKQAIRQHFENSRLLKISPITFIPSLMVTDYEEASRIIIDFWMRAVYVDTTTDVIEDAYIETENQNLTT